MAQGGAIGGLDGAGAAGVGARALEVVVVVVAAIGAEEARSCSLTAAGGGRQRPWLRRGLGIRRHLLVEGGLGYSLLFEKNPLVEGEG